MCWHKKEICPCYFSRFLKYILLRLIHKSRRLDNPVISDSCDQQCWKEANDEPANSAIDPAHHTLIITLITSSAAWQCGTVGSVLQLSTSPFQISLCFSISSVQWIFLSYIRYCPVKWLSLCPVCPKGEVYWNSKTGQPNILVYY